MKKNIIFSLATISLLSIISTSALTLNPVNAVDKVGHEAKCLKEVLRTNGKETFPVIECKKDTKNYKTLILVAANVKTIKNDNQKLATTTETTNVAVIDLSQSSKNPSNNQSNEKNESQNNDKVENTKPTTPEKPAQKPEEKPENKPEEKPVEVDKTPSLYINEKNIIIDFNQINTLIDKASAKDYLGKDISNDIKVDTSAIEMKEGEYLVTYSVTSNGLTVSKNVKITLIEPDDVAPIINGANNITVEVGTKSIDYLKGVTAIDNKDGELTSKIKVDSGMVNLNAVGEYTVVYTVSDKNNNVASKSIKVIVTKPEDKTPPVLKGIKDTLTTYIDTPIDYLKGVTATDNVDGNLTDKIQVDDSKVVLSKEGNYAIVYSVKDSSGNETTQISTVKVEKKDEVIEKPDEKPTTPEEPETPPSNPSEGDETPVFAEFNSFGYTVNSTVLKSEAKDSAKTILTLSTNKMIDIDGVYDDWYQVKYNGVTYYAKKSNIKLMFNKLTMSSQRYNFTLDAYADLQKNLKNIKYIDPNQLVDDDSILQFMRIDKYHAVSESRLNAALKGKGVLEGKAKEIIEACKLYDINPLYLMAHTLHETGNGTSRLAKGIEITEYKDASGKMVQITPTTVYNLFGIGAVDSDPIVGGTSYAYRNGWTTLDAAIKGAAKFVSSNYINHSSRNQNTVYEMRFAPTSSLIWHQYATDEGWSDKIAKFMYNNAYIYETMDSATFEIPQFNK